ncbi:BCS1 N terminal-domain-containing protein [Lineolata rhizophorae]|uniref:BCS1 N terminal-domain-containing protein n=1 Tax=Lineolata rhizophorae TaxID=578093 RepID=A0A6A6NVX2_9PEZI|nr:BCS1 N terminal-domain-containing protein [Lineolata rhizophorae]
MATANSWKFILDSSAWQKNATGSPTPEVVPASLLETFVPGYGPISKFILHAFGFDIAILVSLGLVLIALGTAFNYMWDAANSLFLRYLTSSVFISDDDDLFWSILKWIAAQKVTQKSRSLKAVTVFRAAWDLPDGYEDAALDKDGVFNFGKWAAQVPPQYEPFYGVHRFWHKWRLFIFKRTKKEAQNSPFIFGRPGDEQMIALTCIGRSTEPIKKLLNFIKTWSLEKEQSMTVIRRPAAKDRARFSGAWHRVSSRPSRPLDTVVLDPCEKRKVMRDMNEFLHPSSPRWYATRGIPYRRGYLFHGAPGTGKTSLSFALAGIFGLDIYVISLLEPSLSESDLSNLFNNLPKRCIVLLEDIDTAGLRRDSKSDAKSNSTPYLAPAETITPSNLAQALKAAGHPSSEEKKGISLSGLLNAIDGVATHEGRILVMTTNDPEKLDSALLRPGRVDMEVEFPLSSRKQIAELFIRMYAHDQREESFGNEQANRKLPAAGGKVAVTNGTPVSSSASPVDGKSNANLASPNLSLEALTALADKFASRLPGATFSPAEIQGFLLTRKKTPHAALDEVEGWRDSMMAAKENKNKVRSLT